ncbi:MAG: hypothetical protein ACXAB9_14800 [Candidatus Thorarchaeota archaeon]|jgi:hypothetical protein
MSDVRQRIIDKLQEIEIGQSDEDADWIKTVPIDNETAKSSELRLHDELAKEYEESEE